MVLLSAGRTNCFRFVLLPPSLCSTQTLLLLIVDSTGVGGCVLCLQFERFVTNERRKHLIFSVGWLSDKRETSTAKVGAADNRVTEIRPVKTEKRESTCNDDVFFILYAFFLSLSCIFSVFIQKFRFVDIFHILRMHRRRAIEKWSTQQNCRFANVVHFFFLLLPVVRPAVHSVNLMCNYSNKSCLLVLPYPPPISLLLSSFSQGNEFIKS